MLLIELSKKHLVGVDLRFHFRLGSGSTPISRSCFDSLVELVEDLVEVCRACYECRKYLRYAVLEGGLHRFLACR